MTKTEREEFVEYQNFKFRNRRRMAIAVAVSYLVMSFYMISKIPSADIMNYDGFFLQFSLFCGSVVIAYFGGSSYEETRINRDTLVSEFRTLRKPKQDQSSENEVG